jgi:hypothetical protein
MSEEPPLACTTHLVAHLLREIESGLRDVLQIVAEPASARPHREEIQVILRALEIQETDPVAIAWLRLPGKKNAYGLAARAHRDDLAAPRPVDAEFREFWNDIQAVLDKVLERFEDRYTAWHKRLDLLASKPLPTLADAKFLRLQCPNNRVALSDFFSRLTTPAWLIPLSEEGFFDNPPEPEQDKEKGGTRIWTWPQSDYLARMARSAPDDVLKIILAIPETRNTFVHRDFADAALSMPADLAAELVPKMKGWVDGGYGLLVPRKLGEIMEHLARGGQIRPALELARSLLALVPPPRSTESDDETHDEIKAIFAHREPRPKFDAWEYGEIVGNSVPIVVEIGGEDAFSTLCDLLEEALRMSVTPTDKLSAQDISHVWRPAIEEHAQNSDLEIKSYLVAAVRDAAERIALADQRQVPALVRSFRKRGFRIFLRLAHHLLRKFPDAEPEMVMKTLMCRGLLVKAPLWHEYSLLLRESFHRLSPANQAKLLSWIERGPDQTRQRAWHQKFWGQPATEEQIALYAKGWKRDRLALISEDLPPNWKEQFSELIAALGPSQHPEFSTYKSGGSWGPRTPKAVLDLTTLTIEEIVDYLKTWKPSSDWMAPSPEGLGRELTTLVATDPERFAKSANQFRGLQPTYVRSLIHGLEEASKKTSLTWPEVLKLCLWVAEQPREIPGRDKRQTETDPDWGWTFKAISSLFALALQSVSNPIPFGLRNEMWEVLQRLATDSEPTPESEAEYARCKMDPVAISLNAERPKAIHAVMTYALWVKRNLESESKAESKAAQLSECWFARMPEVRGALDEHLNPVIDRSVGVRSIYGQWLPSLFALDKSWLEESVSRIFPAQPEQEELLRAAWDGYIAWCRPSFPLFELLRKQYMSAIGRIPAAPAESNYPHDSSERLAEHLLLLYGWGKLDIANPLLKEFFTKAPDRIRGHGFHQIGFYLYRDAAAIPPETMERFKALWGQRLAAAKIARDKQAHLAELLAFGFWFASDKLDNDWAVSHLIEVLRISGKVEVEHLVVQRLGRMVEEKPRQVVECLNLMVEGAKESYEIVGWAKDATSILSAALKSTDNDARADAVALINRLDARGYTGFRDLL